MRSNPLEPWAFTRCFYVSAGWFSQFDVKCAALTALGMFQVGMAVYTAGLVLLPVFLLSSKQFVMQEWLRSTGSVPPLASGPVAV